MRIAFFEVDSRQQGYLCAAFPSASYSLEPLSERNLVAHVADEVIAILPYTKVTEELLAQLPSLRLLLTMSAGFDHIDLDACKRRGIAVCNAAGYGDDAVAEHVFGLILGIAKNIAPSAGRLRAGNVSGARMQGFELKGKTLGVVGCGHIGMRVAQIANGFGMRVLVFDIIQHEGWAAQHRFTYVPMDALFAAADIVTLHVPLNKQTRHLIDAAAISKMKEGAILINTARGEIVDTVALLAALDSGKLRAGLDVVEGENYAGAGSLSEFQKRLCSSERALLTPHNAFNTVEAVEHRLDQTIANIRAFIEGKELRDRLV